MPTDLRWQKTLFRSPCCPDRCGDIRSPGGRDPTRDHEYPDFIAVRYAAAGDGRSRSRRACLGGANR